MYADVKTVRTLHLKGTGSRSYGSYARKFFKGESALRVLGTGLLAKEILPWLIKSIEQVVVHSRQPDLKKSLEAQWKVSVQGFTEISGPQECGLLVASPMKSEEILSWMENQNLRITKILDLREESAQDPLAVESTGQVCENLQDVFAAFEKNKASMEHIRAQALAEIQKCVQARFQGVESSAKGWDECAG
jgi:glutamyl-tRNA reductase